MVGSTENEINVVPNIIGLNPISMIQNNAFLMGDFEVAITVLDALNQIASDSVNDVENVIKSYNSKKVAKRAQEKKTVDMIFLTM